MHIEGMQTDILTAVTIQSFSQSYKLTVVTPSLGYLVCPRHYTTQKPSW
jgi:hypothetical protein